MLESEKDQALKQHGMKYKTEPKNAKERTLHSVQEELKLTQEALDKGVTYHEKLKPQSVDTDITYEERVKRREAEIITGSCEHPLWC